jgi:pimeloyl-ACP methyl ester carboxylesterase
METIHLADSDFVRLLENPTIDGEFSVQINGGEIPIRVKRRTSPILIITFAGAVKRHERTLPQFGGRFLETYVPASVIGIADPSLPQSPTLTTAWYAGHEGFETQQILPPLIQQISAACEAERVIFLGGSAGGFAALYYSWRHPDSIAVVTNPQTDIERYFVKVSNAYRAACRPSLKKSDRLSTVIASSVVSCYSERVENSVIFLQNATDSAHVRNHFAPFLAAVPLADQKRILPRLGYWGRDGHAQIPTHEWLAWLRAAIDAPSSAAEDIQQTRKEFAGHGSKSSDRNAKSPDFRLAAALVEQARTQDVETTVSSARGSTP